MDDFMQNLNSMLNGKEIPDNIKSMLGSIMSNNSNSTTASNQNKNNGNVPSTGNASSNNSTDEGNRFNNSSNSGIDFSNIDIGTIMKMQQIVKAMNTEQSNSRANLLRSLKPYLKPSRQEKVEQYIQLFNMEKVIELMNNDGGGKK